MTDLLRLAAELVAIPSVSHREQELAEHVHRVLEDVPWLTVEREGDSVVARTDLNRRRRVLLGGHLDTVPGTAEQKTGIVGDALRGLGAVDMKGGLAVMIDLAKSMSEPAVDVTYVFYACEEVARRENALAKLAVERPELLQADAAILGEPTGGLVEAGCQGTMRAVVSVVGSRAHTARPWMGSNAIHRLAPVIEAIGRYQPRRICLDGCEYTEQLQAVGVGGGVAGNVLPDLAHVTLNYRFAPDRGIQAAEQALRELIEPLLDVGAGDRLRIEDAAGGAAPALSHPLLARLVAASGVDARAKVGWTDVATLSDIGVPATNFGPGDPLLAHTSEEVITRAELDHVRSVLEAVLTQS